MAASSGAVTWVERFMTGGREKGISCALGLEGYSEPFEPMLLEVVDEGDEGEQNDGDGFKDGFQGKCLEFDVFTRITTWVA